MHTPTLNMLIPLHLVLCLFHPCPISRLQTASLSHYNHRQDNAFELLRYAEISALRMSLSVLLHVEMI